MFAQFHRHLAYEVQASDESGWSPPWLHGVQWRRYQKDRHRFGPAPSPGARFLWMRRRGPFGHDHPFGPDGPFEPGVGPGEGKRFFGRGDVKYALLSLLQEHPMHGYEMIKALEERSGGFYTPSAGSVYPTLQLLEDRGFVTSGDVEGKRVYHITEAGQGFLHEWQQQQDNAGPPWMRRFGRGERRQTIGEMQELRNEAMEVARLFALAGRQSFNNPEQRSRLRAIIERTRKDLSDLIYGNGPGNQQRNDLPRGGQV